MKICFVVSDLRRSGGVDVLLGHADALTVDNGFDVDIVETGDAPAALDRDYDVAISTWWETASVAWRLNARTRLAFLQSAEECFYTDEQPLERLGASLAMRAADGYIAISSWLAKLAADLRPGAPVELVPNGIDKRIFDGRRAPRDGPLRVLVEGQPTLWFKGVAEAVGALAAVEEAVETTLVCPAPEDVTGIAVGRVVGGLGPAEMAGLYASTDVLVKLSAVEGLGLAPLEAFHHGVPCVVTPYGGHAEYVRHGENGFIVGFDDAAAVTRVVSRLARDGELLERLAEGARETAAAWPDSATSSAQFATAVRSLSEATSTSPVASLLDAWRAVAEAERQTRAALSEQVAHVDRLNDLVGELEESRAEIATQFIECRDELQELKSTPAYRATAKARSLLERVRR